MHQNICILCTVYSLHTAQTVVLDAILWTVFVIKSLWVCFENNMLIGQDYSLLSSRCVCVCFRMCICALWRVTRWLPRAVRRRPASAVTREQAGLLSHLQLWLRNCISPLSLFLRDGERTQISAAVQRRSSRARARLCESEVFTPFAMKHTHTHTSLSLSLLRHMLLMSTCLLL